MSHSLIWAVSCLHSGARCAENADEVIFRHFQGEGVEFFFNRTSLTRLKFFMRIFWKTPDFIFQWGFRSRSCFESEGFLAYSKG